MAIAREDIPQLARELESRSAEEVLRFAFATFGNKVAQATAFGAEGMVLADMIARIHPGATVFYVDTGFLFPETLAVRDKVAARYPLRLSAVLPRLTPAEQAQTCGEALWTREPDRCCELRKVSPLRSHLASLDAWITAIRRDQAATRANALKIEWDSKFGLVKFNPLADWTWPRVWQYIREHGVPYNELHDYNYPSIGCTHCTRAVQPGEDPRAGRWSGFAKTECGLHR